MFLAKTHIAAKPRLHWRKMSGSAENDMLILAGTELYYSVRISDHVHFLFLFITPFFYL